MAREVDIGAYSAYAIAVKHGYKGTEAEWIAAQEKARLDSQEAAEAAAQSALEAADSAAEALTSKNAAAGSATAAGSSAQSASDSASAADLAKTAAETAQEAAETAKTGAETAKAGALTAKTDAESAKTAAVNAQKAAEEAKQGAETAMTSAETAQEAAETAKTGAETAKAGALTAKTDAESAKTAAVNAQKAAEEAKSGAETAKTAAEKAQTTAEAAKDDAVTAKDNAVAAQNASEQAKEGAETAQTASETAQAAAESAKTTAESAAQTATSKAEELKESAEQVATNTENINSLKVDTENLFDMVDGVYQKLVLKASSVEEVNSLFVDWFNANAKSPFTTNALLSRWFGKVLCDDRVHGVKLPLFPTSTTAIGELTDDSVGLTCVPSTASVAGKDDFAYLPQFWTLEVAMERNADGTHTINKIEHIDPIEEVRSGEYGLCQVLQKNTWSREWKDESYHYMQMCCDPTDKTGWHTWPQGSDKNGNDYPYMANPKYFPGLDANGIPTCGTGLAPMNFTSHNAGVSAWRKRGPQYSGASGNLLKWQLAMIWLKYARKGNSGTIEGCSSYYWGYPAAVSESAAGRIVLTASNASNILNGSSVAIGTVPEGGKFDQWNSTKYNVFKHKRIKSITDVTIDGTAYKAINLELNAGETIDTVAGRTYISSVPYASGWNDTVQGYDGSRYNYTNGKEPGLIQRTEFQNGAYIILSDELWQWGKDADGNYTFDCFTCHDQSKVTTNGTISADYTKQDDLTMVFPAETTAGWMYLEDIAISNDPGVLWPAKVSTAAGSGTGVRAGMYVGPAASGVRAAWCCNTLNGGGCCGLAARNSNNGTTYSYWDGSVGAPSGISG